MAFKIHFRSKRRLKNIKIKYLNTVDNYSAEDWSYQIGTSPFLFLPNMDSDDGGGMIIEASDIIKLKVFNDKFIPYMELTMVDSLNKLGSERHPTDFTYISLLIKPGSDLLMPIRIDFVINNFRMVKQVSGDNDNKIYYLKARLRFNDMSEFGAHKGTSFKVLKYLAKKGELGFASNINDTSDEMTWINPGKYISEFIPDIVRYSFNDENSFMISFVDLYYNLNYINVESQLSENSLEQKNVWNEKILNNEETISPLLLSNHPNVMGTNMYIDKYNLENNSRFVNLDIGYDSQIYYYDKNDSSIVNSQLDTISSKENNKINLKSFKKDTDTRTYYMGKIDIDNAHENYLLARKQNENNIEFLQKIKMNIIINNPNYSVYRFQNVELVLYELHTIYGEEVENKTDSWRINERLSGDWLITGINYIYEPNRGGFSQELTMVKRELTLEYNKERLDELTKKFYPSKIK